jgi:hypothetical protein
MSSKLAERGVYVDEEDLTDAPPEVLQFFLSLKNKKSNETGRQSRRRTEAGCRTQQEELSELIRSLTETIKESAGQDPSRVTAYPGALSSPTVVSKIDAFIAVVNALNADLGTSLSVGQLRQELSKNNRRLDDLRELRAEDSESGETSTLIFGRDVVMVDMPAESAEQSRIPGRAQHDEPVVKSSRILAPVLPAEELGPTASLPNPSGSLTPVTASSHLPSRDQPGQTVTLTTTGLLFSDPEHSVDRPNTAPTPLPSTLTKQASTGRRSSQAHLNKLEEAMPTRKQLGVAGQTSPRRSRKRPAMVPASTQSREKDDSGTESAELPPKRKDKEALSPEILADELTGLDAVERIRHHALAYKRDAPVFPKAWDEHGDWAEQTCRFLDLADEWDETSNFSSLVALILRTHGVERVYIEARRKFKISEDAEDPPLPAEFIDQISPHLREKRSTAAFRTWLKGTKNLLKLNGFLPFIPLGSKGSVAFRKYERLANKAIRRLRNLLDNNSHAQRLAKIGRAFQDCILKRQAFLWEDVSYEALSKLPEEPLLHLLTIRRDPVGKQCDLCDEETCESFTLDELASRQPTSQARDHDALERFSSPDTAAPYNNTTAEVYQTFEMSAPASTALRTADYHPSAALLPPAQVFTSGPQFQLTLPVFVPDTARSINFAMNGNIDGLKYLFTLGLASPNDTSCSRGFSLLRVGLATFFHPRLIPTLLALAEKLFSGRSMAAIPECTIMRLSSSWSIKGRVRMTSKCEDNIKHPANYIPRATS